jgi:serine/threonine protein kinase
VDFGIFGSIAGNRMENINCGSLRYMAPELLKGNYQSTPKIDIWSLGLMLHAMIFGFLPFNKPDRLDLEKQIINEELGYKSLKKLKHSSIKDEYRKHMNNLLRKVSDNLIDLLEAMLNKDVSQRLSMLEVYDHPWIKKYHRKEFDDDSISEPSAESEEEHEIESDLEPLMFNIQENDNETTGNFVAVDMRPMEKKKSKKMSSNPNRHISFNRQSTKQRLFLGNLDKR